MKDHTPLNESHRFVITTRSAKELSMLYALFNVSNEALFKTIKEAGLSGVNFTEKELAQFSDKVSRNLSRYISRVSSK